MIHHGINLVPESLETGEPIVNREISVDGLNPSYIFAFNKKPSGQESPEPSMINGIPNALYYEACNDNGCLGNLHLLNTSISAPRTVSYGNIYSSVFCN